MSNAEYDHTEEPEWTAHQAHRYAEEAWGMGVTFEEFDAVMRLLKNPDIIGVPLGIQEK